MVTAPVSAEVQTPVPMMSMGLVASMRFPVSEPFPGGMEAQTHDLAQGLRRRGHVVDIYDGAGTMPVELSERSRLDVSSSPESVVREHHDYLSVMLRLSERSDLDLVHASCVHHLPLAMSKALRVPFTMTLHSPPTQWLESAITVARHHSTLSPFVAVSRSVRDQWLGTGIDISVIPNGIDTSLWQRGPGGGGYAMWSGRIVPEKGVEDAIDAAHLAGMPILIAGPRYDEDYFATMLAPRLQGRDSWVGHLPRRDLVRLAGLADVSIVSPKWDEPYGLVAAESLAAGTPVATYARGGLTEFIDERVGALARPDDVVSLAEAVSRARSRDRSEARRRAVVVCSLEAMVSAYEQHYARVLHG